MATDAPPVTAQAVPDPPGGPPRDADGEKTGRRWGAAAVILPLLLVAVAGTLRFYSLDHPPRIYFDEVYYVADAREYRDHGVERGFAVHPPVGKWVIAGGMAVFGDRPLGWRAGPAAAGTLTVLFAYLAGLRLFRRRGVAALGALLLAVDGLAFTTSRISMLDAILTLFVVAGFWLLLVDRDRLWAGAPARPPPDADSAKGDTAGQDTGRGLPPPRPRGALWLAGVALGLSVATKWSGVFALAAAVVFLLASDMLWRRRHTGRWNAGWWRGAGRVALAMVVVPAAVYVLSYAPWFANLEQTRVGERLCPDGVCELSVPRMASAWWQEQTEVADFHLGLTAEHPYRAAPATWPLMTRPVAYYYESCPVERQAEGDCVVAPGNVAEVIGMGNPAVWWLALAAYPVLAWFALRRRDWRAWALLAFLVAQYAPWLFANRPAFLFYMAPVVPFMCLALAYAAWRSLERPWLRWLPGGIGALAVAGFLFWYPLLAGSEISRGAWQLRIWLRSWI